MQSASLFQLITRRYFLQLKWVIFLLSALPFVQLYWQYYQQDLGINPLEYLTETTGKWAVIFLIITLTVTPFKRFSNSMLNRYHLAFGKRLSDWNFIIKLRRQFGLYSFFYALLHLLIYVWLDQNFEFEFIVEDIEARPFILVGIISFLIYILLTATSNKYMIRRLKRNWQRLHRLMYPLGILVLLHIWWQGKEGIYNMLPYSIVLITLLLYRVLVFIGFLKLKHGDTGMMVDERKEALERQKRYKARVDGRKTKNIFPQ